MRVRKTQKEGMEEIQCQNPSQSYHEREGAKDVTKELGELYENSLTILLMMGHATLRKQSTANGIMHVALNLTPTPRDEKGPHRL
jgi:hypothetical protein